MRSPLDDLIDAIWDGVLNASKTLFYKIWIQFVKEMEEEDSKREQK